MSTNYYFKVKDIIDIVPKDKSSKLKESLIADLKEISKDLTNIHIGKRNAGWEPIFKRTKYFSSVKDIVSFYESNKNDIIIVNEYDEILTFEELDKQLLKWNIKNENAKKHEDDCVFSFYRDSEGFYFSVEDFC